MATEKKVAGGRKSEKPADNAFQQQRLKAWQPLLTPNWVIGTFFIVGIAFIIIGALILSASQSVVEVEKRYDNVQRPANCPINNTDPSCQTTLSLTIPEDMNAPVYFYYKLKRFYQNHRRYVKSRSDQQLKNDGDDVSSCDPLKEYDGKKLYPCGLIANSYFNDTFTHAVVRTPNAADQLLNRSDGNWDNRGIAWSSDKNDKFERRAPRSDETGIGPGGFDIWTAQNNEEFIVWMRTAGLPNFKKLHRKIKNFDFKKGQTLEFKVQNVFPVADFEGEKWVVLSTTSWLGGKNDFLGWAYIVVGSICMVLAVAFLIKQRVSPRVLGDMKYFNFWPKSSPAATSNN